jgi:hypothetical protein
MGVFLCQFFADGALLEDKSDQQAARISASKNKCNCK